MGRNYRFMSLPQRDDMRLLPPLEECNANSPDSDICETITVSSQTLEELSALGRRWSGDMPGQIGMLLVVRALLEGIENADPDFSLATGEDEIRAIVRDLLAALPSGEDRT
jgi:hypothetical protein